MTAPSYPTADDYVKAVQNPEAVFRSPEFTGIRFPRHPLLGVPMPASGSSAVVFKALLGGQEHAVRFFIRPAACDERHYRELGRHVRDSGTAEHMATADWIADAITVNQQAWPAVRMQWVEGRTLDQYVDGLVEDGDVDGLRALAGAWRSLVASLQRAEFAHGDLQHGNVLVDSQGRLRLVDFDGAWLHCLADQPPPSEGGHRNYQRSDATWGRWMDTFPGLVIYASLLALVHQPALWGCAHNGENLIFTAEDLCPPFHTPLWTRLATIQDASVGTILERLKQCCDPAWSASGELSALLQPRWWEQTANSTTVNGNPAPASTSTVTRLLRSAQGASTVAGSVSENGTAASNFTAPAPGGLPMPRPKPASAAAGRPAVTGEKQKVAAEWFAHRRPVQPARGSRPTSTRPRPAPPTRGLGRTRVVWLVGLLVVVASIIAAVLASSPQSPTIRATISVGGSPVSVAVPSDGRRAYVGNKTSNAVSVIDTSKDIVTRTFSVSPRPTAIAVSPDGSTLYAVNDQEGSVAVLNTASGSVTNRASVGRLPHDVAVTPGGTTAYVVNTYNDASADTVSVMGPQRATTGSISVGQAPMDIAITPSGGAAYVTNSGSNTVTVFSTGSDTVRATVSVGRDPQGIAVSPDGKYAYVGNRGSNTVSVIDTATNYVTRTIAVSDQPDAVAITGGGNLYVATTASGQITVIDAADEKVLAKLQVGPGVDSLTLNPEGTRIYAPNGRNGTVAVVDTDES